MSPLVIRGLQHLGIPVTRIDRSSLFYQRLGFTVEMSTTLKEETGNTRVTMLKNGNLMIELYERPLIENSGFLGRSDGFIDHVALDVPDIDAALKEIKSMGLPVLEENAPVKLPFWQKGVRFFTVRGPDGEKIEFNQRL
ncbi:MAG: VOC family protein [Chloroflexi bacterium]|jgi:lactoylglutathione lyase|nr:VOC family protein [Chloroflexota bacterium]BCY18083.1 lactoylglutathione lyase [Leptolinea sp. HRD-7]